MPDSLIKDQLSVNFHLTSYELHKKIYDDPSLHALNLYRNWFSNGTVDVWRHKRMLKLIDPFLKNHPKSTWLCVGDGHYGTSSMYINSHGSKALATDLNDSLLKVAKENNMIEDYMIENAESLSFADQSFDYTFCKESFHHFPRPYIALYEMLRVSKKALILIEPRDWLPLPLPRLLMQKIKHLIKHLFNKPIIHSDTGNFEPVGNYIFGISEREIQRTCIAIGLTHVAFNRFTDVYYEGVESELTSDNGPLFKKIKRKLMLIKWLVRLGISSHNQVSAIIFTSPPEVEISNALKQIGYQIIELPLNPISSK